MDGEASYAFRVPYDTQAAAAVGSVAVAGPYELGRSEAGRFQRLDVPAAAVRDGHVLVGPDLRGGGPALDADPSEG